MGSDADEHEELMQALSEANYQSDLEVAIAERDRLRRELEALRDDLAQRGARWLDMAPGQRPSVIGEAVDVARRIDAILTGEGER